MHRTFAKKCGLTAILSMAIVTMSIASATTLAQEQDLLAPPEIPGEAIYIPFPVEITVDGDLSDWEQVPSVTVTEGTLVSPNPAENGSFTFAVAADMENLYFTATTPDRTIISGKHGTDYWNEDSFEIYLNTSGDLHTTAYNIKTFQMNVCAASRGNTSPKTLAITGMNVPSQGLQGFVFETADGWGFEVVLPLKGMLEPAHGLQIGFQFQLNGASELDRDVKLIWSNADTDDKSWTNPSVFGRALFFEVGQTEIPMPGEPTPTPAPTDTPAPTTTPEPTPTPFPTDTPVPPTPVPEKIEEEGGVPTAEATEDATGTQSTWWVWVAVAGLILVAGVTLLLWRSRRP